MKKKMTLEDLAVMFQNQFLDIKAEFAVVHTKLAEHDARFESMGKRFDIVDIRLDRIENLILTDHRNRIERIEDRILLLEKKQA